MGLAGSDRMAVFVRKLLKSFRFEDMRIPLGIVATDLATGEPVVFRDRGEVTMPLRELLVSGPSPARSRRRAASCRWRNEHGSAVSRVSRSRSHSRHFGQSACGGKDIVGGEHVDVVNRCFQIVQSRTVQEWRDASDVIVTPQVGRLAGKPSAARMN